MRTCSAIAALLVLAGCGGFDNLPLTEGVVRGQVAEAQPGRALVSVLGRPDLLTRPSGSGEFVLSRVPQGATELFIVASDQKALRAPVVVRGAAVEDLGLLTPRLGAFLKLHLRTSGHQRLGRTLVEVAGTPYAQVTVSDDGNSLVGPLPEGCYDVAAQVPGFGLLKQSVCLLEDDELELELDLPEPDGSPGREGCLVTGCEAGAYTCRGDGRCEGP